MAITSDTNRVAVGYVEETTFGVTPATPAIQGLRITGAPNFGYVPTTVTTDEIRPDRQVTDLILVGAEAGGDIAMEVSFRTMDAMFEGALGSAWEFKAYRLGASQVSAVTALTPDYTVTSVSGQNFAEGHLVRAANFSDAANNGLFRAESGTSSTSVVRTGVANETPVATSYLRAVGFEGASGDIGATAGGTNSIDSTALDFTTLNLNVGEWLKIGGDVAGEQFATAENNGWVRISAIAANQITLDRVPTGWATDAGTSKTVQVFMGESLTNGVVAKSYSIERRFTDQSPVAYEVFTGMRVNTLTINFTSQSIMTAAVNLMGKDALMTTTRTSGATDVAAGSDEVLNTSSDVGRIGEGGVVVSEPNYVLEGSLAINNNLRRQNAVANLGSVGIGYGEFNVTGTLQTYFGNIDLAAKVIANTQSSFDLRVGDDTGQTLVIELPALKFSNGAPNVAGKNQDTVLPLEFQAYRHSTLGYTMLVQRFWEIGA